MRQLIPLEIVLAVIGLIQTLAVAIIGGLFAKDAKKRKEQMDKADKHAAARANESLLAIRLMSANMKLSIATASAVRDGRTNGLMEDALTEASSAADAYETYLKEIAVEQMAKRG